MEKDLIKMGIVKVIENEQKDKSEAFPVAKLIFTLEKILIILIIVLIVTLIVSGGLGFVAVVSFFVILFLPVAFWGLIVSLIDFRKCHIQKLQVPTFLKSLLVLSILGCLLTIPVAVKDIPLFISQNKEQVQKKKTQNDAYTQASHLVMSIGWSELRGVGSCFIGLDSSVGRMNIALNYTFKKENLDVNQGICEDLNSKLIGKEVDTQLTTEQVEGLGTPQIFYQGKLLSDNFIK